MSSDQNRYVPLGIENTLRALRAFDALSQRVAPLNAHPDCDPHQPHHGGARPSAQGEEAGARPERRGLTAEVLYDFFRGEFEQYERLAGLGFRYAESMLDLAERTTHKPTREACASPVTRAAVLTFVSRYTEVVGGHFRLQNPSSHPVSFTLSISELRGHPDGVVHGVAHFKIGSQLVERVNVAAGGDAIVAFEVVFQPHAAQRVSAELYASGGGLHEVFPVLFVLGQT